MKIISKKLKTGIKALAITCLLIITVASKTHAQHLEANMLFNEWHLDTYAVSGIKYPPNKKEKEDFILFKEDLSFISKSEGKQEEGTYILNTNGSYVLMRYKNVGKLKANIISVTKKHLILKFDINEMRDVEVHYNSPI
ncbi:MAG: hypothetical protein ACI9Y7_000004 [Dokdonia sp.]|jgi:hypothetical protein